MILEANHYGTVCYKGMTIYLTHQVSPSGLSGSALALRYSTFASVFALRASPGQGK